MALHETIDVELEPNDTVERIVASFEADRGWTIEREPERLLIYPRDPKAYQLDPPPDTALYRRLPYPETLAVAVSVTGLDGGGAHIEARLVRRKVGALVREAAWQMMHPISYPNGGPLVHAIMLARWR